MLDRSLILACVLTEFGVVLMIELLTKLSDSKANTSLLIVVACGFYVGKLQLDHLESELIEVKRDQKELTKFLADHAATWARLAERVEFYNKEK
jgi:hypothetical protein